MREINEILRGLTDTVDLGLIEVPMFIAVSAVLVLLGVGLRRSWLTLTGLILTFAFYAAAKMSNSI